jgi:RND superfamily putative drug exporter
VTGGRGIVRRLVELPGGRRGKWLTAALWVLIAVAAFALGGRLGTLDVNTATAEMPRGEAATRVAELAGRFPDGDVSVAVVVYARDAGLTAADREKIDGDRAVLRSQAVAAIDAPVVAADGKAAILVVPVTADGDAMADRARAVRDRATSALPDGLTAKLTGQAGAALDARDSQEHTDKVVTLVTVLVVILLLLIVYRSPLLWILPLLNVGVAFALSRAVQYLLAAYAGMPVNPGNSAVVTVLVFGVGTDYALLLLSRYREELHRHEDRHEAMRVALRGAVPAVAASAATVSLALLCLLAARMGFNFTLGTAGAISVACGLASTVTLLPALLVVLGRWIFWPLVPRPAAGVEHREGGRLWHAIGRGVSRRPRLVWVLSLLLLGGLAAGMSGMRIGLDSGQAVAGRPQSVAGQELLAAHFPAGRSDPVRVVADRAAVAGVEAAVRGVTGVAQVRPAVMSADGTLVRVDAILADAPDSPAARDAVRRVQAAVAGVPAANAAVGGATAARLERDAAQNHDRDVVIPLVLAVVFVLLVLLLRALTGALLLMITVVGSYAAALGASWLLFDHVFGFAAADVQLPLVGFLFLVALGADYNIFLMVRVREEAERHGYREGLRRAVGATGGVITSAGVVLAATFAALNLAPLVAFKEIGTLVALGVLLDTLVVRLVLVPAIGFDLGGKFWWPRRVVSAVQVVPADVSAAPVVSADQMGQRSR